jgi:hypothetical protein
MIRRSGSASGLPAAFRWQVEEDRPQPPEARGDTRRRRAGFLHGGRQQADQAARGLVGPRFNDAARRRFLSRRRKNSCLTVGPSLFRQSRLGYADDAGDKGVP